MNQSVDWLLRHWFTTGVDHESGGIWPLLDSRAGQHSWDLTWLADERRPWSCWTELACHMAWAFPAMTKHDRGQSVADHANSLMTNRITVFSGSLSMW